MNRLSTSSDCSPNEQVDVKKRVSFMPFNAADVDGFIGIPDMPRRRVPCISQFAPISQFVGHLLINIDRDR